MKKTDRHPHQNGHPPHHQNHNNNQNQKVSSSSSSACKHRSHQHHQQDDEEQDNIMEPLVVQKGSSSSSSEAEAAESTDQTTRVEEGKRKSDTTTNKSKRSGRLMFHLVINQIKIRFQSYPRLAGGVLVMLLMIFFVLILSVGSDDDAELQLRPQPEKLLFSSGISSRHDEAFRLALQEVAQNIQRNEAKDSDDGTFIAGAGWTQLWTRDTSYALELALSLLYPEESMRTLLKLTQQLYIPRSSSNNKGGTGTTTGGGITADGRVWLQDSCGHFGGWPALTDAIVGAQGSWSLYLATGDLTLLEWAHNITQNTLRWAETEVFDSAGGNSKLFKGCSSFMESNSGYPTAYKNSGKLISQTKALSTNILYYNGYKVAAQMAWELLQQQQQQQGDGADDDTSNHYGYTISELTSKANQLKGAIQKRLWMEDKGYYAYFEDEQQQLVPQMEGLGESLLLLAPEFETNTTRIQKMFQSIPMANDDKEKGGIPCLWPPFDHDVEHDKDTEETKKPNPRIRPTFDEKPIVVQQKQNKKKQDISQWYHNGRIWPFVQGYWAIAAARHRQLDIFTKEMESLLHLAYDAKPLDHERVVVQGSPTFAEFYEIDGSTYMYERRRQLWSSAGYLGMILQGLVGIQLEPQGIRFRPVKPKPQNNKNDETTTTTTTTTLENLVYRKAILMISIKGYGTVVDTFQINGKLQKEPFLSSKANGIQRIEISLK